jgi:hypothetical protein
MTFAQKLGGSYEAVKDQVKIKKLTIEVGTVKFDVRVRIPLKKEMEALIEEVANPSEEIINRIFDRLSKPVLDSVKDGGEDFLKAINAEKDVIVITKDDLMLDGQSVRQIAMFTAMWENKVERYFHLLQSESGTPIDETFEQIAEEFPEPVIRQIVEAIETSIKPDYKSSKKN